MKYLKYSILLTVLILTLTACSFGKKDNPDPVDNPSPGTNPTSTPIPSPTPQETQLPDEVKPTVNISTDKNVQNVTIEIENLPKDVTTVDYELVYTSEGRERGVIGIYRVSKGSAKALLGSCSSGVCVYDKDITSGTLTIKYKTDSEKVLLRYPFNPY